MKQKDFLTLADFTSAELMGLLKQATIFKQENKQGKAHPWLKGKTLGMIFEKSSTRTRISFEVGMTQLGGHPLFLSSRDLQLGRGESISDTAKVMARYVDGLMIRTFGHEVVEEFAKYADIPVINGLTDMHHPCQVMADLLTIQEHKGKLAGLKLCYIGDGNNMAHSLLEGGAKMGMDVAITSPEGYLPNQDIVDKVRKVASDTGSKILITPDPKAAIAQADVVVTDVWASMGQEEEQQKRLQEFESYQVNAGLCKFAKADYLFLHCLPAHRGEEVTADVIDGPHSAIFDEAENRLHAQKAILHALMS